MKTTQDRGTPDASIRRRYPGRRRRRERWPAAGALAAALLAATMLSAGCSSGPAGAAGGGSGAAAGENDGGGTVAGQLLNQGDQDLVNFARCMRAHGVQMPDPYHQPGHTGLTVDTPPSDAANQPAYAACNHFMQALVRVKQARTEALASSQLAALTRYAECMRAHDITMLDPTPRGELDLGDVPGMANNDFGRYSPQFRSADAACRHLLPPGVTDDGSGP